MSMWGNGVTGAWLRYLKADTLSDCPPLSPSPGLLRFISWHYTVCISSLSSLDHFYLFSFWLLFNWCDASFPSTSVNCKMASTDHNNHPVIIHRCSISRVFIKKSITCVDARHTCSILSGRSRLCTDFATFSKTLLHKQVCLNEICKR